MLNKSIKIGIKPKAAGNHTISIDGLSSLVDDYEIMLEDKDSGAMMPMDASSEYVFTSDGTEANERFELHFSKTEVATDIEDETSENEQLITVHIQDASILFVDCEWQGKKQVKLFSLDGRMVDSFEFNGADFNQQLNLKTGVYIVKVLGDNKQYEQKVYVSM